MNLYKH